MLTVKKKTEILASLGDRIRAERLAQNITQENLAKKSNVAYGTLRVIEKTGKGSMGDFLDVLHTLGQTLVIENIKTSRRVSEEGKPFALVKPPRQRASSVA